MQVTLPPDLEQRIADRVAAGTSASSSEVVEQALRLLFETEAARARLRAAIQVGIDQLDRGESVPGEQVMAELREYFADRRRAG
jgi:antitoxin ParD1/3/4